MGFSKEAFLSTVLEIVTPIPEKYGAGEIVLPLRLARNEEFEEIRSRFVARTDDERTGAEILETIKSYIFVLLCGDVRGIADFPADERSLAIRARAYFNNNAPELQSFFDAMLFTAWQRYKEQAEPEAFFRAFQIGDAGSTRNGETV